MNKYQKEKERIRQKAIDFQRNAENQNYSWGDIIDKTLYFENMAKRYGLKKEFKENGII